ncbi:MAG: transcription initiation factor IIB [Promethearchaeota archaeon]
MIQNHLSMEVTNKKNLYHDSWKCCPECRSESIFNDSLRGELICTNCGLILESNTIDQGAEWRSFDCQDYEKKSRVGAPFTLTLHDKGLSTIIDWRDRDGLGKKLSPAKRAQAYRLRKWQIRMKVHSAVDRNLAFAMSELDRLASQLGIQKNLKEASALIYRKTVNKNLIRGRSIEAMIAASIYAACRLAQVPRTLDEFAKNSRIDKRDLGRSYRLILRQLNLKITSLSPNRFVSRFANDLKVSQKSQVKAMKILKVAQRIGITSGKDPCGLAAASIYVAVLSNGEKKTQKEIARVANITEVTVRNRYKELVRQLNLKIEPLQISH